jgi:hypothetical protein
LREGRGDMMCSWKDDMEERGKAEKIRGENISRYSAPRS